MGGGVRRGVEGARVGALGPEDSAGPSLCTVGLPSLSTCRSSLLVPQQPSCPEAAGHLRARWFSSSL